MVELQNVSKSFVSTKSLKKVQALSSINLKFDSGVYGLLGPNGSGKTTLLRCLTELYSYKGIITNNGVNIKKDKSFINSIGYLPQHFELFKELTVFDMMMYFSAMKNIEKSKRKEDTLAALEMVNLSDNIKTKVGSLSGGMLRRVGIAQAIIGNPSLIILDEPTVGLDIEERLRFKNIISKIKENKTIILSTHIIEDVEALCDNIVILNKSEVLAVGNRTTIAQKASGKVFELPLKDVADDETIQKRYEKGGIEIARIITDKELKIQSVEPTVEDGYICYLKNI